MRGLALLAAAVVAQDSSTIDRVIEKASCHCSMCIVEKRPPALVTGDSTLMCAAPPMGSLLQGATVEGSCAVIDDQILGSAPVVSTDRYCFYHCKPPVHSSDPGTQLMAHRQKFLAGTGPARALRFDSACVGLGEELRVASISPDMNGKDAQATKGFVPGDTVGPANAAEAAAASHHDEEREAQ
eukprot:CAMPEP_0204253346 /NCGR_PEP_ID=MMETSP0468-20130131/1820_1 /ASSEMBLY_ACC=CAM_ASM_000383 /TAXON_ID=2969 /ORGANISM="Oxyrrhis marina" /LENGTH=183 /DNA_ID=CAMNT_0051226907 /DNA_START=86 /DNA_END=638 /DNA_ORIENTATION=+